MGSDSPIARAEATIGAAPQEVLDGVPAGARIGVATILGFANLIFPAFGAYSFNILWDGNELRVPITLTLAQSSPAA
jgi:hypothetical protein